MALLDDVRKELRIASTAYDAEVTALIGEAKLDLELSGLTSSASVDETDLLVCRAIKSYAKANFGLGNTDSEKYINQYNALKNRLAMNTDRNTEV